MFRSHHQEMTKSQHVLTFIRDLVLVILGLVIAMGFNSCLQNRSDKNLEKEYLERLKTDVELSISENSTHIQNMKRYAENTSFVYDSLIDCKVTEAGKEKFSNGLYTVGKYNPPIFIRDAVEELLATGKFNLISNEDIRSKLIRAMNETDAIVILEGQITSRVTPHVSYIESLVQFDIREPIDGTRAPSSDKMIFEYQNHCEDEKLKSSLSATRSLLFSIVNANTKVVREQTELLSLINNELEDARN